MALMRPTREASNPITCPHKTPHSRNACIGKTTPTPHFNSTTRPKSPTVHSSEPEFSNARQICILCNVSEHLLHAPMAFVHPACVAVWPARAPGNKFAGPRGSPPMPSQQPAAGHTPEAPGLQGSSIRRCGDLQAKPRCPPASGHVGRGRHLSATCLKNSDGDPPTQRSAGRTAPPAPLPWSPSGWAQH